MCAVESGIYILFKRFVKTSLRPLQKVRKIPRSLMTVFRRNGTRSREVCCLRAYNSIRKCLSVAAVAYVGSQEENALIRNAFDRVYQSPLYTPMFDNFLHNTVNHGCYTRDSTRPSIRGKLIKRPVQFNAGSIRLQIDNCKKKTSCRCATYESVSYLARYSSR